MGFRWSGVQIPPARPNTPPPQATTTYASRPRSAKRLNPRAWSLFGTSRRRRRVERDPVVGGIKTHGSRDSDLAYRDRRRTRCAIPESSRIGRERAGFPAEDETLVRVVRQLGERLIRDRGHARRSGTLSRVGVTVEMAIPRSSRIHRSSRSSRAAAGHGSPWHGCTFWVPSK